MGVPARLDKWIAVGDACVMLALLSAVLLVPIGFLLPFSDEWLRMNYLADHSPWQWSVMHCETWVVRPTAELVMAWASLSTTRRALGESWNAATFLPRFQAMYALLALALLALLYGLARVLVGRRHTLVAWAVAASCIWICLWSSDGLGYAFYWADGYANVVLPFVCMLLGMALWTRGMLAPAALCLVLAALGHEVLCIYGIGFVALQLYAAAASGEPRVRRGVTALLLLGLTALLYAQAFSAGPAQRSRQYLERTGKRYDLAGAWHALQHIDVGRSVLAFVATLCLLAIYRRWLDAPLTAAVRCARERRWFWISLVAGTLATSVVPLASIGLKKSNPSVDAYSVATELFVVLAAALSYPLLDAPLTALFGPYRKLIRSGLPLPLCVALLSPNLAHYRSAARQYAQLRSDAQTYMQALFAGRGQRVTVTRPCHPFLKRPTGMTMRNARDYFGLARLRERQCRAP